MVRDGPMLAFADAFGCRTKTVENIRQRIVTEGFDINAQRPTPSEAAMPPAAGWGTGSEADRHAPGSAAGAGFSNWTLRLLAERVVELEIVESIQLRDGFVGRLKKTGMTKRKIDYWVIPPEADGEFVAHMEQVLDTYAPALPSTASGGVHG